MPATLRKKLGLMAGLVLLGATTTVLADGQTLVLRAMNGAFAAFDEAQSGTLTVGKRADIVVLDRDITEGPTTAIADGKVLVTLIDGIAVHEGEGLPKPSAP